MNLVLDTSPLIFITKLGYLDSLRQIFELHIPKAVLDELTVKKDDVHKEITKLVESSFIIVDEIKTEKVLESVLHPGEAEAIGLAKKMDCWVALDDSKARKIAEKEEVSVIGTAGLLKVMAKMGIIDENPEEIFEKLSNLKFRMKKEQFLDIFRN